MKRLTFALAIAVLLPLISACAGGNDEPPAPASARPDTVQASIAADAGIEAAAPRAHEDPDRENYMLRSDTALFVRENGMLSIVVRGPLGDGCQRLEYMDSVRNGNTLYLTFWASRPTDPNVICTQQMQAYDRLVRVESSLYSQLGVLQPDGSARLYSISEQ